MNGIDSEVCSPAWTIKQAATFLNAKKSHVYRLIHSGALPFQMMGDHFLVPRASVERLLNQGWHQNGSSKTSKSARN